MTWLRQVAHVAAKDARMGRYVGAAFLLLVLLLGFQTGGAWYMIWGVLVFLSAPVLLAQAVHADAAVRDDAFWVSRPLGPGAIFAAKVVIAALLLAIMALGEVVVLLRHAVSAGDFAHLLLTTARGQATLLCIGLLIATLTRDTRGFLLTVLLGLIAWAALAALLSQYFGDHRGVALPWLAPALVVFGTLAIAGYHYVSGRRLRAAAAAVVLLAVGVAVAVRFGEGFGAQRATDRVLAPGLRPDSLLATSSTPSPAHEDESPLTLRLIGGSSRLAYALLDPSVTIRRPDGSSVTSGMYMPTELSSLDAIAPPVPGARWVSLPKPAPGGSRSGLATVNGARPVGAVRLDGEVEASEPGIGARIPLRVGETVAQNGRRIHIQSADVSGGEVSIQLAISRVASDDQPFLHNRLEYALLDRGRGLVFPLHPNTSGRSGFLFGIAGFQVVTLRQGAATGDSPVLPGGPGPYELLLIDWTPVGSYPVSLPITK